jgi:restriction system protein
MSLWMVRAGSKGEYEQEALNKGIVAIVFDAPNLTHFASKKSLKKMYSRVHPNATRAAVGNLVGQMWRFAKDIETGDLVVLPLKAQKTIAVGRVIGDYEFRASEKKLKHIRRVAWLKTIPRSRFDQDLLYSLGSFMTVCQIKRNDAENRIVRLADVVNDEGLHAGITL